MRSCSTRAIPAAVLLALAGTSAAAQVSLQTLALTRTDGPLGPNLGTGIEFQSIDLRAVDDTGPRLIEGQLSLGGSINSNNDTGEWQPTLAGPSAFLREGDPAPGFPAGVSARPIEAYPANGPVTVIHAVLSGVGISAANDQLVWRESSGAFNAVARDGDTLAGLPAGAIVQSLGFAITVSPSGFVSLAPTLTGTGVTAANNGGLWGENSGGMYLAVRKGDNAPGAPAGQVFFFFSPFHAMNDSGDIAFSGRLTGPGVTAANDSGVWLATPSGVTQVAREGDVSPDGAPFSIIGVPTIDNAGDIVFVATTSVSGVWRYRAGTLTRVVAAGDAAPDAPAGTVIDQIINFEAAENSAIAFHAELSGGGTTGGDNQALFIERSGVMSMAVRRGDLLPSPSGSVRLSAFTFNANNPPDPAFVTGSNGEIAFRAFVALPGDPNSDRSLWHVAPDNTFREIVRLGDTIEVAPGDLRTVSNIEAFSPSLNDPRRFDASGRFQFELGFNGGATGILFATPLAACPADLTTSSDPNNPTYGVQNGVIDAADFFYFLDQFVANNFAIADLTGSSDPNNPGYGVPDGILDTADFFYYLDLFVAGCP